MILRRLNSNDLLRLNVTYYTVALKCINSTSTFKRYLSLITFFFFNAFFTPLRRVLVLP